MIDRIDRRDVMHPKVEKVRRISLLAAALDDARGRRSFRGHPKRDGREDKRKDGRARDRTGPAGGFWIVD